MNLFTKRKNELNCMLLRILNQMKIYNKHPARSVSLREKISRKEPKIFCIRVDDFVCMLNYRQENIMLAIRTYNGSVYCIGKKI